MPLTLGWLFDGRKPPGYGKNAAGICLGVSSVHSALTPVVPQRQCDLCHRHTVSVVSDQSQKEHAVDAQVVADELHQRLGVLHPHQGSGGTPRTQRISATQKMTADETDTIRSQHRSNEPDQKAVTGKKTTYECIYPRSSRWSHCSSSWPQLTSTSVGKLKPFQNRSGTMCSLVQDLQHIVPDRFWNGLSFARCQTHLVFFCGAAKQTMSHIVNDCPLSRFPGGLATLHLAGDEAIKWLGMQRKR